MPGPKAAETDRLIGARLKTRRMQLGLSQSEIAAGLEISWQAYRKWESGLTRLTLDRLRRVSPILQIPVSVLRGETVDSISSLELDMFLFATSREMVDFLEVFRKIDNEELRRDIMAVARNVAETIIKHRGGG